ncbi:hypothetical protein M422DRAFT_27886 [Sphaerobolus stellatus SS14]|nr:hypothetical protein M422DRAFT_27886 [Sphaerobolus stellatus SS14]
MSAKYAGLPDIDTAPDVYETPDTFTTAQNDGNSSEEEAPGTRAGRGGRKTEPVASREELDPTSLLPDAAAKKFRNAEKRREHRPRLVYAYPPSPTSDKEDSPARPPPLSQRLRMLQHEIASLEAELSDPSSPLLHDDNGEMGDPGVLMKGLLDVRSRLEKVSKTKEGRGKLVERITKPEEPERPTLENSPSNEIKAAPLETEPELADIDKRLGELESLVGAAGTTLDESSPLPPPLLPLITRLSNQLTILTQPRHIDSISRRLKLLVSDLERASSAQVAAQNRRQSPAQSVPTPSPLQESLQPVLQRLSPMLPHIPHILARLRTLSTLHTSAAAFQETLQGMEEEQRRVRAALEELEKAVEAVEKSLDENGPVISSNVAGLDVRVEELNKRMTALGH